MSTSSSENIQQFALLQSFVSPTFWHKFSNIKIDLDRLSDAPKTIYGYYTNLHAKSCLLEVDYTAFNTEFKPPKFCHQANGTIYNKNTIEEFKECDKNALLLHEGQKLLRDFHDDCILDNPSLLTRFLVLSFADLKCHNYYYWFAFPCPVTTTLHTEAPALRFQDIPEIQHFSKIIETIPREKQNFFVLKSDDHTKFYTLREILEADDRSDAQWGNLYFCFADASEYEQPCWLMRTYAAFVYYRCPHLVGKTVKFLGIRYDNQNEVGSSIIWQVKQLEPVDISDEANLKFVGWEPNRNNKMGPRVVSMKDSMNSHILADNSINLNLKLMKWRLVPDLDLDVIKKTKCLLFGAGTLGCAVARNLLGWGFKHITFIDNGRVSFANPVRQFLYTFADAKDGNIKKAEIAAKRLQEINPCTVSAGYAMQIPMPGYTIGESLLQETENDLNQITQLVKEHDCLFLLTDSRESRWLPTVLSVAFNKIVINAALGFDSFLVMRHGSSKKADEAAVNIDGLKCIAGSELGCYFCHDVTAPGNSTKDRTLDQQCTVTRPGVSNLAASYAVELLVSLLQHPLQDLAPAYYSASGATEVKAPEGLLGIIPHSIRGQLATFDNILPATQKFSQCVACSEKVSSEYEKEGNKFLFKVFETAKYLEDLTGISNFNKLDNVIIEYDDSVEDMSDE